MIKEAIARVGLRMLLPSLDGSGSQLDRLMAKAVRLQFGQQSDEDFRMQLEDFYSRTNCQSLIEDLRFPELRTALDRPHAYKVGVVRLASDPQRGGGLARVNPWRRRFGLLQHLHIRCDVLILRQGEQVPPHGHHRVVSGFYLLEGRVACRHYDRVREVGEHLLIRESLDLIHEEGGFTTNSESHHNIHWLQGIAPASYLFRVTVTETRSPTFGNYQIANERVYVDPTGPVNEEGLIRARYVSESVARSLVLCLQSATTSIGTAHST